MTTEEIQNRVDRIKEFQWDVEAAHRAEDNLRRDFIASVAILPQKLEEECDDKTKAMIFDLAAKAQMVLATENIDFPRWCAER